MGCPVFAQSAAQTLEGCVERLASKALALPHERRVSLVWTNHAALDEDNAEKLRAVFVARLEAAQVRIAQGESATALRVSIEQTPSQIVFVASVPGEGGMNVVIAETPRSSVAIQASLPTVLRLEKKLRWQQESRILSAVLPAASARDEEKMILLGEEALVIYGEEQGIWQLLATKPLPMGTRQPMRSARGQLVAEEHSSRVAIVLPGWRCEANWADDSPINCAAASTEMHQARLLALPACGTRAWWLRSDGVDWISEDQLTLRNPGAANGTEAVAKLTVPGPVLAISGGPDAGSATAVVHNVATGNYEVYRVALACVN